MTMRSDPDSGTPERADRLRFFRSWLADPKRVASIAPSGQGLARLITRDIDPASAPVLELGPGTGVFTQALLDRGLAQEDLTLIEFGAEFIAPLRLRFPGARILQADAARLSAPVLFPGKRPGAVISGLPLLSLPRRKVMGILNGAFACLRPGGAFYQFTYGPRCPVPAAMMDRLGLRAERIGGTLLNLPPATVYRITPTGAAGNRRARSRAGLVVETGQG